MWDLAMSKPHVERAGDMAQHLRVLASLVEDLGSIQNIHTEAQNCLLTLVLGDPISSFGLFGHWTYTWYICMYADKHIHIQSKFKTYPKQILHKRRTGEMAQLLREIITLAEDMTLIPSTHTAAHSLPQPQFQGTQRPLLPLQVWDMHVVHIHTSRQNTDTRKIKIFSAAQNILFYPYDILIKKTGKTKPGVCWYISIIPAFRRLRQEDQKFKV